MSVAEKIAQGGDERIRILDNGLNKYYIHPADYKGVFNRGSCTCNPLTEETFKLAEKTLQRFEDEGFASVRKQQEKELKDLINFGQEDRFEIFFAPSGSDLCYYPLLFSKLIDPEHPVHNILTCPEELGSGSLTASTGQYFFGINQFGEEVAKGSPIGEEYPVSVATFPARDTHGNIIDHRRSLLKEINEKQKEYTVIGNLVIGSKSGIYDNINIIPDAPSDMLWVIDMCQFRAARSLVHELIDLNAMVMITGSKFYQAPPFCGALLVPKDIIGRFSQYRPEDIEPFTKIFSSYDIPECLPELRGHFREYENEGLVLRWESAIHEIKAMSSYKTYTVLSGISKWNDFVVQQLQAHPDHFELMPDQDLTNKTIISFRMKDADGEYLDDVALREVYKDITLNEHPGFDDANRVIIGQPVKYTDRSFIRLALGAGDLRLLLDTDFDLAKDKRLVQLLKESLEKLYW